MIKKIIIISILLVQSALFGNSIFSRYGWVEQDFGMDIYSQGMGETGIADIHRDNLCISNSALLTTPNKSVFSTSLKFGYDNYDDGKYKYKDKEAHFSYASLIIPVSKNNFLGLRFSSKFHNYLKNCKYFKGDSEYKNYKETNLFDGTVSNIGFAYAHKHNLSGNKQDLEDKYVISIGFGFNYYFGQNIQEREIDFADYSFIDYRENIISKFNGINFSCGFTAKISRLTIGGFFDSKTELNNNYKHNFIFTNYEEQWANEKLPVQIGVGINFCLADNINIESDYRISMWKDIDSKFFDRNSHFVSFGGSYLPAQSNKFIKNIPLRCGFYYKQLPFKLEDNSVDEIAVSCGFDIPIKARLLGKLSIAFQYGMRGTVIHNGYGDRFVKFSIGVFAGDYWKKRRARTEREIPKIEPKYEVEEF